MHDYYYFVYFNTEDNTDHYENLPKQYTEIFLALKIEKFQLKGEAVLTSTHNLCFGAKIRKIGIPLHTPVLLYKSGV